jgi:hypothetical protein
MIEIYTKSRPWADFPGPQRAGPFLSQQRFRLSTVKISVNVKKSWKFFSNY